jgi:pimeloyl-ACP methyl ester carboxylesterase
MYEKAYPQATFEGINECGHIPSVEQPEVFYKILFKFLETSL